MLGGITILFIATKVTLQIFTHYVACLVLSVPKGPLDSLCSIPPLCVQVLEYKFNHLMAPLER